MSKDTNERGKGSVEAVDWTSRENLTLFEGVRAQGFSDDDIRRIIAEAESPQAALDELTRLADPLRGKDLVAKPRERIRVAGAPPMTPPLNRKNAELDPHEEQILKEIVGGEIPAQRVV